jgi:predicted MFS family arabinose efflux permease
MAVLTAGLERRRLLARSMAGFSIANLLAAVAPGYAGLLAARLPLALFAASFMPVARGYAAAQDGPERRGRALSMVSKRLTLAIIAGVPLGVLVSEGLCCFPVRARPFAMSGLPA